MKDALGKNVERRGKEKQKVAAEECSLRGCIATSRHKAATSLSLEPAVQIDSIGKADSYTSESWGNTFYTGLSYKAL